MGEIALELKNIAKSFFGIPALRDVNYTLKKGEVLSLIGENGAGKSTMMNIVGGVLEADSGELYLEGKLYTPKKPSDATDAGIAFIHQELNLFTNLSISDNIYISSFPTTKGIPLIKHKEISKRVKEILDLVELSVSPDTIVDKLSPGERQLVEISKALSSNPKILIFDEPTTSLTSKETEKLFGIIEKLKSEGKSIIYISHILADVQHLSDHIVVLRDGCITDSDKKENFSIDRMISSMIGRDIEQLYPTKTNKPSNKVALEVKGVSQKGVVHDINLKVHKGEVVGVFGLMGSGRSELARIVFGLDPYDKGQIIVNNQVVERGTPAKSIQNKIAFVTENRRDEGLLMEFSILENLSLVTAPQCAKGILKRIDSSNVKVQSDQMVNKLKIKCPPIDANPAKSMSGGNQQKVVIGKWLLTKPDIFIVDEPTRGIDVGAKYEVYNIINQLATDQKAVWVISSELEELIGICDRILVMSNGEIYGELTRKEFNKENIMKAAFKQVILK